MSDKIRFEDIPIGMELKPMEILLDENVIEAGIAFVQWESREAMTKVGILPPGLTISNHARMQFNTLPDLKAAIWAKSEHEFIKPMKAGTKIIIRGKVVDKYEKRGKNYVVGEFETVDENGDIILKSLETSVYVE
ncbi:MAG: hypothetical protein ISS66_19520 [Desulfobacteraceae bacterium]|nr:hypothetical protein [Desulfobacteraceae bacterium]